MLRRFVLGCSLVAVVFAIVPETSEAAPQLALKRSDYPSGSTIAALPATNSQADILLGPIHRSTFERLHRIDGVGWLQAASWKFKTGRGAAAQEHRTIWGYGINVFPNARRAKAAVADKKLPTRPYRIAHLAASLYRLSDVRQTIAVALFTYRNVEVEAYYEYYGVAPASVARRLHHIFSRQGSHLAHEARLLVKAMQRAPTAVPADTPTTTLTPTFTATAVATAAATLTPTPRPTSTARPTATPLPTRAPSPTPTATQVGFVVSATTSQPTYPPGAVATAIVKVTYDQQPVAGATVVVTYNYGLSQTSCTGQTDATGTFSCSESVPQLPNGTEVLIQVRVAAPNGDGASTATTYTVQR